MVTIANKSSCEHCVAICSTTDSLRHNLVRALFPNLDCESSKYPRSLPCSGLCLVRGSSLGSWNADGRLPFSDNSGELVPGCAGDDRETLRSFAHSHYVRRLGIV